MKYLNKALLESTSISEVNLNKLDEASKETMADKIITRLYRSIKKKSADIDFPDIEASAGDVNKITGYKDLKNSINFLAKCADKGHNVELKELCDDLMYADQFLTTYKKYFTKAYGKNNTILKSCYVSVVGIMIQLTAYAIAHCIDFVNDGTTIQCQARPRSPKLKNHSGYKCLKQLLELMKKNKLDKNFKDCLSLNEATIGLAWLGVTLLVLTSIRGIIYMFLTTRIKISEYLDMVKDFLELNQANVRDPQIKQKQMKWVNRLETLRDKISVDQEVASARAEEEINQDNEENLNSDNNSNNIVNDLGLF